MTGKALVVGINDYGSPQNNLPSCIADAKAFGKVLESHYGFRGIRYVFDAEVTRARLEQELNWLCADATPDDRLVFYYSGHGYTKYVDGNMEEFLVLRDGLWPDNELSMHTRKLPPDVMTVILDSCFSGGMLKVVAAPWGGEEVELAKTKVWTGTPPGDVQKAFTPAEAPVNRVKRFGLSAVHSPRGIAKVLRPDAFPFPLESPLLTPAAAAAVKTFALPEPILPAPAAVKAGGVEDEPNQLEVRGLLISACLPDETAAASTPRTKGMSAFTYALLETLPSVGQGRPADQVLKAAAAHLKSLQFRQTPMILEPGDPGDLKNRVFITFDAAPARAVADDKFWGAIAAVLPSLVSAVAPTILNTLTGRGKGLPYDLGDPNDPAQAKGFGSFFRRVARHLPGIIRTVGPVVVHALRKGQPTTSNMVVAGTDGIVPEETEKFWGALATVLPSIVSAVAPMVVDAFTGRGKSLELTTSDEAEPASATAEQEKIWWDNGVDIFQGCLPGVSFTIRNAMLGRTKGFATLSDGEGPVADEKFWGALAAVVPSLIQHAAPIIINAVTGAQRKGEEAVMPAVQGVASSMSANGTELVGDEKFWPEIARALPSIVQVVAPVVLSAMRGQTKGFHAILDEADAPDEKFWRTVASIVRPLVSTCAPIIINTLAAQQRKAHMAVKGGGTGGSPIPDELLKDITQNISGGHVLA